MKSTRSAIAVLAVIALGGLTACEKEPDQAEIHRRAGHKLMKEEKFVEAANEYDLSLKADPKQEKVWEQKAFALMKAGKTDEAAEALLKTTDFKADQGAKLDVYRNIAGMYLKSSTPEKAEKYFVEILKAEPKDEQSMIWLGELFSLLGGARVNDAPAVQEQLEKAVSYYDQAATVNPGSVTAYVNKRIALTKMAQGFLKAKADAEQTAEDNKKDKELYAESMAKAAEYQTKVDELKVTMDETTAKLTEALKAQKGAGTAQPAAAPGGAPAAK